MMVQISQHLCVLVWCLFLRGVTSQCTDSAAYGTKCQEWADDGACVTSSKFMLDNCPTKCETSSCKCPAKAVTGFAADTKCDCLLLALAGKMVKTDTAIKTTCPSMFQLVTSVNCGIPPPVKNTDVQYDNTFYLIGVARYKCKVGYVKTGGLDGERWCQKDGSWKLTWHQTDPACSQILCPKPTDANGATWTATDQTYGYGTRVTYACNEGLTLTAGDTTSTCQLDKTWSGTLPTCQKVKCGTPSKIQNGKWSYTTGQDSYEDVVTYTCSEGFSIVGGENYENVTCQANGKWSAAPQCTFGTAADGPKPVLFVGGSDAVVVFAIMFPVIFALFCVVIIQAYALHRLRMREQLRTKQLSTIYKV